MADQPTPAAERGRLTVAPKVVERVTLMASREVDGVVGVGSGLNPLTGGSLPSADVHIAGTRARVEVSVAARWPQPLPELAAGVRDTVRDRLTNLLGMTVDAVTVEVAKVVHEDHQRRVQ